MFADGIGNTTGHELDLLSILPRERLRADLENLSAAIGRAGERAAWRFLEFFTAGIRNWNTRAAYARAVSQFFAWCEKHSVHTLEQMNLVVVAAYIEQHPAAAPTVTQHLAASVEKRRRLTANR